jgi:hypothetical protein
MSWCLIYFVRMNTMVNEQQTHDFMITSLQVSQQLAQVMSCA